MSEWCGWRSRASSCDAPSRPWCGCRHSRRRAARGLPLGGGPPVAPVVRRAPVVLRALVVRREPVVLAWPGPRAACAAGRRLAARRARRLPARRARRSAARGASTCGAIQILAGVALELVLRREVPRRDPRCEAGPESRPAPRLGERRIRRSGSWTSAPPAGGSCARSAPSGDRRPYGQGLDRPVRRDLLRLVRVLVLGVLSCFSSSPGHGPRAASPEQGDAAVRDVGHHGGCSDRSPSNRIGRVSRRPAVAYAPLDLARMVLGLRRCCCRSLLVVFPRGHRDVRLERCLELLLLCRTPRSGTGSASHREH